MSKGGGVSYLPRSAAPWTRSTRRSRNVCTQCTTYVSLRTRLYFKPGRGLEFSGFMELGEIV